MQDAELTTFLMNRLVGLRAAQSASALATISAIDQMLNNVEHHQALATLASVNEELLIFVQRHPRLKPGAKPAHTRLLGAVRTIHARKVWAATRRGGEFWNFDVYQHLGAAAEAKRRCSPP